MMRSNGLFSQPCLALIAGISSVSSNLEASVSDGHTSQSLYLFEKPLFVSIVGSLSRYRSFSSRPILRLQAVDSSFSAFNNLQLSIDHRLSPQRIKISIIGRE